MAARRNGAKNRNGQTFLQVVEAPAATLPGSVVDIPLSDGTRRFATYEPLSAFEFRDELDFLTDRAVEANAFFTPTFLVPAMPRLDERAVKLLVVRDENAQRSRLRFLMPFSVERAGILAGGPLTVRAWTHPFGPRGTLPLDHDDPAGMLATLLEAMREPAMGMPPLLVIPDLWLGGPVAALLEAEAARRGLPHRKVNRRERAAFDAARPEAETLARLLPARRRRELRRLNAMLEGKGSVRFDCARTPEEVREALEGFLVLEASGWKGRARTALLDDRYRAAFAREAVNACAEKDRVRIYTLRLDGAPVASLVVLVTRGEAVLWKMGYDERFARASPGFQLLVRASEAMAADPDIRFVDSCAASGHSLMSRIWQERIEVGTFVIGLDPSRRRDVERAAQALERSHRLQRAAWQVRQRIKRVVGRS